MCARMVLSKRRHGGTGVWDVWAGRVPQVTLRMYCRRRVGMCARMVFSKHRHGGTGVLNVWAGRLPQATLRKYCRKRVGQHGSKISSANSVSKLFGDSWEGQYSPKSWKQIVRFPNWNLQSSQLA